MVRPRGKKFAPERVKEESEYTQKVLDIRRTARVVAGGRRFSFRATVVVGNKNGKVGIGVGKGPDVSTAMGKAGFQARKSIISVPLNESKTIPHEVFAKFSSARVVLKPAPEGRGLVVGGPIRLIAEMCGIKNMTSKILGRTVNKLNNAKAAVEALEKLNTNLRRPEFRSRENQISK